MPGKVQVKKICEELSKGVGIEIEHTDECTRQSVDKLGT